KSARTASQGWRLRSWARAERLDAERLCHLVDLCEERRCDRHARLLALLAACGASLSRHADFIDTRQALRAGEIADVAVHFGLEYVEQNEAGDVERDHELPDIERSLRWRCEITYAA